MEMDMRILKRWAMLLVVGIVCLALASIAGAQDSIGMSVPMPQGLDLNVLTPAGDVRIAGSAGAMGPPMDMNMAMPWLDYAMGASRMAGVSITAPAPVIIPSAQNPAAGPLRSIRLINPAETATTLTYFVDGKRYRLGPGRFEDLRIGPRTMVRFDRGGGLGMSSYVLTDGIYAFDASPSGWMLRRAPATP
jgi:hypothetical protein